MNKNNNVLINAETFCFISLIAGMFGYWFAFNQVNAVSLGSIASYPKEYLVLTIIKCYLTIILFYIFTQRIMAIISQGKISATSVAFCYLPLLLVYSHQSLLTIVSSILGLQLGLLLIQFRSKDYQQFATHYLIDILILCLFVSLHIMLTTRYSPLHWNMAMFSGKGYYTEELPVLAPLFRGYLLAKQFSFSYVDHAQWAGIMNPPISISSPFLQLIIFIFDIPSISYQTFHEVLAAVIFILFVLGSFGCYLFLYYAAHVKRLFAVLGGYLFFFSGAPFLEQMIVADGGVLLAPYAIFPYTLLFATTAFAKQSYKFAALSGVAIASQFFFWTPHPEGVIYSLGVFALYLSSLVYYSDPSSRHKKILLALSSFSVFFLLSAFQLLPIIYDQLTHNMFVFAHTGDSKNVRLNDFVFYILLLIISSMVVAWTKKQKSSSDIQKSFFLTAYMILTVIVITSRKFVADAMINFFHIGLHFSYSWRLGMYFYFSVLIAFIITLDQLIRILRRDNLNEKNISSSDQY